MKGVEKRPAHDGHGGYTFVYREDGGRTHIKLEMKMRNYCCGVWELGVFTCTVTSQEKVTEFLTHVMNSLKQTRRSSVHCNLSYYGKTEDIPNQDRKWIDALKACKFQVHPFRWKNMNTGNWIEEWSYFKPSAKAPKKYFPTTGE